MVPNQYWVPGMFSPMPLMGKYYLYYGQEFLPPAELGRKNVERMVYELLNDNAGICRFHRQWSESITDEILMAHYALEVNFKAHQFALGKAIHAREYTKSQPWESERVIDMIQKFLENWKLNELQHPELEVWLERFQADKWTAAHAFWQAVYQGQIDAFRRGPDAIPDMPTPHQAKAA
jgi:glyceraldehyde-3-phosphate dehydrogenase (ferredoxin)